MLLLLHIIVTYIKENIITKLQKLYSPPRKPRTGNKSPALFAKKPLCTGDLLPARKIFIERPVHVADFLQSGALYANIRHDLRSEYNQQKSERSKHQRS